MTPLLIGLPAVVVVIVLTVVIGLVVSFLVAWAVVAGFLRYQTGRPFPISSAW